MSQTSTRRLLVAIETDATRYYGVNATRPKILGKSDSGQMLAHLAADLTSLLPELSRCHMATAGALFDQTQILRPGYPAFSALEKLLADARGQSKPARISLGAENGKIPLDGLQPEAGIPMAPLQLLPIVVSGESRLVDEVGLAMEHRFMDQGQVSAHTASWLENALDIRTSHARFMTLMDLHAMFRMQLEHFGFLDLWTLLDAALNASGEEFDVTLENGPLFSWRSGSVHTTFQTFDHWSNRGGGKATESSRGKLAGGYAQWTRSLRQFSTTLAAHAVPLVVNSPGEANYRLEPSFLVEDLARTSRSRCAEVTEHSFAELGTVCVTVAMAGRQQNYYPLTAQGLNDIQSAIRSGGLKGKTIAFPGTILYSEKSRTLVPEPLSGAPGR